MKNRIIGTHLPAAAFERFPGIGVDIPAREVTAGNIYADAVSLFEYIGRGERFNDQVVCLARFDEFPARAAIAIAHPGDGVGEVHIEAAGEILAGRINIEKFDREVGILGGGRYTKEHDDRANDLYIFLKGFSLENHYVAPGAKGEIGGPASDEIGAFALVEGAVFYPGRNIAAQCRYGMVGVKGKSSGRDSLIRKLAVHTAIGMEVEKYRFRIGKRPTFRLHPVSAVVKPAGLVLFAVSRTHYE